MWHRGQNWYAELLWNQYPTILSLLTEEYQTRMVQEAYHDAHDNAPQWPAQYCWPEGFMRRWHYHAVTNQPHSVIVTPTLVQFLAGDADNFITNIHIGRTFNMDGAVPHLGAEVPKWYGDTIGFWDGDALITWTSSVQGWKVHGNPEFSGKLQTIEIYTPNRDKDGKFLGLNHEGIFYDPEALVEPIRMIRNARADERLRSGRALHVHRVRPDDLPGRWPREACRRRHGDSVQGARHVWPAVGEDLGGVPREGHAAAGGEGDQSFLRIAIGSMRAARRVGTDTATRHAVAMTSTLAA